MDILLELADREIKEHKSAEMLATELLVRVARAESTLFGEKVFEALEKCEVNHE